MPGTEANERTATYLAERLREFGFDSVAFYHYEVLLPRPVERQVELVALERYRLQLSESPLLPPTPCHKKAHTLAGMDPVACRTLVSTTG